MPRVCFHKVWAVTDILMLPKNSSEVRVAVIPHSPLVLKFIPRSLKLFDFWGLEL